MAPHVLSVGTESSGSPPPAEQGQNAPQAWSRARSNLLGTDIQTRWGPGLSILESPVKRWAILTGTVPGMARNGLESQAEISVRCLGTTEVKEKKGRERDCELVLSQSYDRTFCAVGHRNQSGWKGNKGWLERITSPRKVIKGTGDFSKRSEGEMKCSLLKTKLTLTQKLQSDRFWAVPYWSWQTGSNRYPTVFLNMFYRKFPGRLGQFLV